MATSHLQSAQIAALGKSPLGDLQNAGEGAGARTITISGTITPLASDAAGSTYQMVRIPTFACVKWVGLSSQAQGAGKVQCGVYYSSAQADGGPSDGTPAADVTSPPTVITVDFFASDQDLTSAVAQTDITFANAANAGKYNQSLINQPLWQALGLASDPGGFFDIVLTVHTTAITTGTGFVSLQVEFAE